jgi:hypothetical protein
VQIVHHIADNGQLLFTPVLLLPSLTVCRPVLAKCVRKFPTYLKPGSPKASYFWHFQNLCKSEQLHVSEKKPLPWSYVRGCVRMSVVADPKTFEVLTSMRQNHMCASLASAACQLCVQYRSTTEWCTLSYPSQQFLYFLGIEPCHTCGPGAIKLFPRTNIPLEVVVKSSHRLSVTCPSCFVRFI